VTEKPATKTSLCLSDADRDKMPANPNATKQDVTATVLDPRMDTIPIPESRS
jgi:hypothetical protein